MIMVMRLVRGTSHESIRSMNHKEAVEEKLYKAVSTQSLDNFSDIVFSSYLPLNALNTRVPFTPPKPKEFERAQSVFLSRALLGT